MTGYSADSAKKKLLHVSSWLVFFWLVITLIWWGLAFWPAGNSSPQWLTLTRSVCFGINKSGLPDTWGWTMLLLAPGSMLGGVVTAYWDELRYDFFRLARSFGGRVVLAVSIVTPGVGLILVAKTVKETKENISALSAANTTEGALPAHYLRTEKPAPPIALVDQHGKNVQLSDFMPRPVIVTFAFAHCTTMCPAIIEATKQTKTNLLAQKQVNPVFLYVSLDPWRDTPGTLPSIAQKWDFKDDMYVLSGKVPDVERILDAYNVPRNRSDTNGDITHPALVYVIDGKGQIAYSFNNPSVQWLTEASMRVAGTTSNL